ncbi:phage tail fiber domain-containing protein [Stutzerimonas frequens]|uniref:phage tail fiber domain-containing protein n=1 Tax=Stutzerimonas frequens TaxID=2968969 RepID=UPI00190AB8B5|nr:phage tail fiber protein [Stutzerimonas frequens]MBK3757040.1 hypothetical protein [Stutzerimonas frequens]MBK3871650.1 hypothetical protein [Stutzerimonas frequens]MBK3909985.1 hypothetical protein [Stutzerimonas frequens]MBK3928446.1 hypothetical protein [Stutzerimonas frequens]
MALARVTYTQSVSGNRNFSVPFPYLSKDHVKVTVNGAAVTFSWLSASSIQLTTAPAIGAKVEVRRVTERNSLLVDFADGSTLTESQLDLASKQNFYLSQEADDLAVESNGLAKAATDTANAATTTANQAKTLANTAVSTANSANSTASTADSKATSAVNTATAANNKADQALAKANSAEAVASSANTKADNAVNTANLASAASSNATSTANAAKTQAERAETASTTATSTANQALDTATTALQNSANASYLANQSELRAQNAEAAAQAAATDAATAVQTASDLEVTVNQVLEDVQAIAGGDLSDFTKNSLNLSDLTDKVAAKANLGMGNVDNTSDLDKPISTATQQALDALQSGKANATHSHSITQVSGLQSALDSKAASVHSHAISDVTGLQTALDGKANDTVSISAGAGLTGGGTLEANRSLAISAGVVPVTATALGTSDLNTITTPGFYYQSANANATTARNYPNGGAQAGSLVVTTAAGVVQEYTTYGPNSRKYIRGFYSTSWSAWKEVYTKNITISTAAPSGGTDGDVWIQY